MRGNCCCSKNRKGMLFSSAYDNQEAEPENCVTGIKQQIEALVRDLPRALLADRIEVFTPSRQHLVRGRFSCNLAQTLRLPRLKITAY